MQKTKLFRHRSKPRLLELIVERDGLVIYNCWEKQDGKEVVLQRNGAMSSEYLNANYVPA